MNKISKHYDILLENGNDPCYDSVELAKYMDGHDGEIFIEQLEIEPSKVILEIGCGTGRIARKIAPLCKKYVGIDVAQKTTERAMLNLNDAVNTQIVNGDFLKFNFGALQFDVICSTLTFMHVKNKKKAVKKAYKLLKVGGKFVVSIDKNQAKIIDAGYTKIRVYPDNPQNFQKILHNVGFNDIKIYENKNAFILSAIK